MWGYRRRGTSPHRWSPPRVGRLATLVPPPARLRRRASKYSHWSPLPLAHHADLLLLQPLFELLQQMYGARDARRGQSLDGARREATLQLAGAQQPVETAPRQRD